MNENGSNIYFVCRKHAGLTRAEAAFRLGISERTMANYESYYCGVSGHCPPDEIILKMSEVYNTPHLPFQHIIKNTLIGQALFPEVRITDLPSAFLNFQSETADITPLEHDMRKAILDDQIDEDEVVTMNRFNREVLESAMSGLSLVFSTMAKQKTPVGAGALLK